MGSGEYPLPSEPAWGPDARNWCTPAARHRRNVECVRDDRPQIPLHIADDAGNPDTEPDTPDLTIADVAKACGLPQPVIAQLVPRTWTAEGWMYTQAQLQEAVEIASRLTRPDGAPTAAHINQRRAGGRPTGH